MRPRLQRTAVRKLCRLPCSSPDAKSKTDAWAFRHCLWTRRARYSAFHGRAEIPRACSWVVPTILVYFSRLSSFPLCQTLYNQVPQRANLNFLYIFFVPFFKAIDPLRSLRNRDLDSDLLAWASSKGYRRDLKKVLMTEFSENMSFSSVTVLPKWVRRWPWRWLGH